MTASRVRRGGSARTRSKAPARLAVPRKIAERLPVDQRRANRLAGLAFTLFVGFIGLAVLVALDVPSKAASGAGEAMGEAGFRVRGYEITGLNRMARQPIDAIVSQEVGKSQLLVDVAAIRARLLRFGWVKDARVSRRLPDVLVIDIVERRPAALWQDRDRLALIDSEGVVLDHVSVGNMPDLPLLIGPGANARERELSRMMDMVPTLKPQLASATWVSRRRWDLAFQSGEVVALPEGELAARNALVRFARLERESGLLGRGLVRFDLRVPGKMIVRLPRTAGDPIHPASELQPEG